MKIKLRLSTFLLFAPLFFATAIYAQDSTSVTGTVTDAKTKETLPGVAVTVKGASVSAQTDVEGKYTIKAAPNATLVFSYLGFTTLEIPVNNQTTVNAALATSTQQLEQVVVVGYGTQRKRDLTGAISRVEGAQLAKQPVQTPTQAVQGKVAGVQVIASGQPNSQPQIRIRGTGSVLGGVNPLYVVDGVLTDDIRNINNSDILTMDILKDASAAIYGVRAANGVIIITTKKGRAGEVKVNYDANAGFRQAANLVQMADRNQYLSYVADAAPNRVISPTDPLLYGGSTDWYDEVLRNAFQTNHNISVSGGSENATYFFSGGYVSEEGILETNKFDRFTFRGNSEVNVSKKIKFNTQLSFSRGNTQEVELGDTYRNLYRASPLVPAKVGDLYGNTSAFQNVGNPLLSLEKRNQRIIDNRFQGNIVLDYKPIKQLTLRSGFNTDVLFTKNRTYNFQYFNDESTFTATGGGQQNLNSLLRVEQPNSLRWVWDNTATFEQAFGKHKLTLLAGSVTEKFNSEFITGQRIDVPANEDQWFLNLGNPDVRSTLENGGDRFARQSFIGRVNYDYANKYLLSASLRADGSSRFSKRWGYFPTVGLGWVLSEEDFLKDNGFFDFLKFRGSFGLLGNDNIPSNAYILTADINIPYFFNNGLVLGSAIQQLKDPNLKWETTTQFDAGFEFSMLKSRLSGEFDFYSKKVDDALAFVPLPRILGDADGVYITNIASFKNQGLEFSLNWKDEIKEGLTYSVGGNITYNKNELLQLNGGQALLAGSVGQQGFITRSDNGREVGSYFVYDAVGVFQNAAEIAASAQPNAQPGDLRYRDVDGNGSINDNDKIYAGSYQPKIFYGFNLGLNYKDFDLTADFFGNAGNKIYNGKKAFRFENTDNVEADFVNNRWTSANPSTTDPRILSPSTLPSTYFIESASFLRLNNLTLGYKLPEALIKKTKLSNLRLFLTAQNLFTITNYSGFSPEIIPIGTDANTDPSGALSAGIELNPYPITRTFAFGINLGF